MPPESWSGNWSAASSSPTTREDLACAVQPLRLRHPADLEPERDVVDHAPVREEAEVLEDHRDVVAPHLAELAPQSAPVTSRPAIEISPAVGSISRISVRTSVDLPEPERPITTNTSPGPDVEAHVADGGDAAGLLAELSSRQLGVRRCR